jgi:hypothetical protein
VNKHKNIIQIQFIYHSQPRIRFSTRLLNFYSSPVSISHSPATFSTLSPYSMIFLPPKVFIFYDHFIHSLRFNSSPDSSRIFFRHIIIFYSITFCSDISTIKSSITSIFEKCFLDFLAQNDFNLIEMDKFLIIKKDNISAFFNKCHNLKRRIYSIQFEEDQ